MEQGFAYKHPRIIAVIIFVFLVFLGSAAQLRAQIPEYDEDDLMTFETVVQGYYTGDYVMALPVGKDLHITLYEFARTAGFVMDEGSQTSGFWGSGSRRFSIDIEHGTAKFGKTLKMGAGDVVKSAGGEYYYSPDFLQRLFGVTLNFDTKQMTMSLESDEQLPITMLRALKRKSGRARPLSYESYKEFDFDKRWFSEPVVDLSLTKGFSRSGSTGETSQSDSYTVDIGMIMAGLDSNFFIFGSSETENRAPRARMLFARTLLEEPGNMFNLKRFEAGDITGTGGSGFFTRSGNGRGVQVSSFKNLVTSADKTITISGVLADGWEAELYLNDQLISFRQPSFNGRYEFPNIPVNFGLNNFRVVLYGPQGELVFEEKRYWSGSSPVTAGELGYSISAFQQGRSVIEANEPRIGDSDAVTFDSNFYYGLGDRLTLMSSFTSAPGVADNTVMRQFGMAGLQYVSQGFSTQYNALYGFNNDALGHHVDIQGDIVIANVLARYEYYGDLESPQSYFGGNYLKDLTEIRLTGVAPLYITRVPWFLSLTDMTTRSGDNINTFVARIAPNILSFFTSMEYNRESSDLSNETREQLVFIASRMLGKVSASANYIYLVSPENRWSNAGLNLNYRVDRNTFLTGAVTVTNRSAYSNQDNLYTYSASAARAFPFGALTLRLSTNSDNNMSAGLTYRMSFARNPFNKALLTNPETPFTRRAAVAVKAVDEEGNPVSGVAVRGMGAFRPTITNDDGLAVITDMPTYAKTFVSTEADDMEDVSLTPNKDKYKQVLRPNTVYPLTINFTRKGEIEGQVKFRMLPEEGQRKQALNGFTVQLRDSNGNIISQTYTDAEGFFVMEQAPFGHYELVVLRDGSDAAVREVHLNDVVISINEPLEI